MLDTIIIRGASARLRAPYGGITLAATCALCEHLHLEPRVTASTVAVRTSARTIIERASDRFASADERRHHVVVPVCPEHAVDIFRGRIDDVEMAWQIS